MTVISKLEYNQQLSILHKTIREERENLLDVFRKRETFKRNYQEILAHLHGKNYVSAAEHYFSSARKHLQRRDYDTTSVLALLGTLCLFNASLELTQVQEFVNGQFLKSTFSIKVLQLLMDAKADGFEDIYADAWNLMKAIPVFEEEKSLINNIVPI